MSDGFANLREGASRWLEFVEAAGDLDRALAIVAPFEMHDIVNDEYEHDLVCKIYRQCADICRDFWIDRHYYERSRQIPLKRHKKNLEAVVSAAKRLRRALSQDMLLAELTMPSKILARDVRSKMIDHKVVEEVLDKLETEAAALLDDRRRLLEDRRDVDTKWEPERALIWEPYFILLAERLGRVPVSRSGPVMRGVLALHAAIAARHDIAMPEPSPESVYTAIQDFNCRTERASRIG